MALTRADRIFLGKLFDQIKIGEKKCSYFNHKPITFHEASLFCKGIGIDIWFEKIPAVGFIIKKNSKKLIVLNKDLKKNKKRYVLLHEVGHYLLHKEILSYEGYPLRLAEGSSTDYNNRYSFEIEREAKIFALIATLPDPLLKKLQAKGRLTAKTLERMADVSSEDALLRIYLFLNYEHDNSRTTT